VPGDPDPGQLVPPCDVLPADGIVDDAHPCFLLQGNVETWRRAGSQSATGGSYYWTYTTNEAMPDGWVKWRLHLPQAGRYRVEARVVSPHNNSIQAPYEIRHGGQTQTVRLNQFAAAGWRELGMFAFASGGNQWVALYDNSGEPYGERVEVMADSIRVTLVEATGEPTPPQENPGPTPPEQPPAEEPGTPGDPHTPPAGSGPSQDDDFVLLPDDDEPGSCSGCRLATGPGGSSTMIPLFALLLALLRLRARRD
jgi:hypothetical protein